MQGSNSGVYSSLSPLLLRYSRSQPYELPTGVSCESSHPPAPPAPAHSFGPTIFSLAASSVPLTDCALRVDSRLTLIAHNGHGCNLQLIVQECSKPRTAAWKYIPRNYLMFPSLYCTLTLTIRPPWDGDLKHPHKLVHYLTYPPSVSLRNCTSKHRQHLPVQSRPVPLSLSLPSHTEPSTDRRHLLR